MISFSGAGTNFFFGCVPPLFLALQVQLVGLESAFVMVSTVWSVSCWLFFYLRCSSPCPAIVPYGVGAGCIIDSQQRVTFYSSSNIQCGPKTSVENFAMMVPALGTSFDAQRC